MRAWAVLIILTLMACAVLASHRRKPFELRIDGAAAAKPATWPTNASASIVPDVPTFVCAPVYVPGPLNGATAPISET